MKENSYKKRLEEVINFLGTLTKEEDFDYGERPLGDWIFEW